jgi:hypothetical protein
VTVLLENPVAIAVLGGVFATVALVIFLSRRSLGSAVALGAILALTLVLLAVERLVVTDREAVEQGVDAVLAAIEANDLPAVLAWIDPSAARVRADAEALMPLVKVSNANAAATEVEVASPGSPPTATAQFRAYLQGVHGSSGMSLLYVNQRVDLEWVKQGDRWLISDYKAYYDNEPIDAIGSARGNRPVPGRSFP